MDAGRLGVPSPSCIDTGFYFNGTSGWHTKYCLLYRGGLADRSLDFTQSRVTENATGLPTTSYQNDSPLVVVNGTFFSFADNRNLNLVIKKAGS
jgi:hypothetical protein